MNLPYNTITSPVPSHKKNLLAWCRKSFQPASYCFTIITIGTLLFIHPASAQHSPLKTPLPPLMAVSTPTPTFTPWCIPEWCWLERDLPDICEPGVSFDISFTIRGGTASIVRTEETLPAGWTVVSPQWDDRQGDTYTWNYWLQSYTVVAPASTAPGTYYFSGETTSYHWCNGYVDHSVTGENEIVVSSAPTVTPTATATNTPSQTQPATSFPTATPSATPTHATGAPPIIMAAGYGNLPGRAGGELSIHAYIIDPDGLQDIDKVEIYYAGSPFGIFLSDDGTQGDFNAGDGVFGFRTTLGPNPGMTKELFELRAMDHAGNESRLWPYLTVTQNPLPGSSGGPEGNEPDRAIRELQREGNILNMGRIEYFPPLSVSSEKSASGSAPPGITLAGYWDSGISTVQGGQFTLIALVHDVDGLDDIASVEIYFNGRETGLLLSDDGQHNDGARGDGLYGFTTMVAPGIPAGNYLFELVATDRSGNSSLIWPWLIIE